MADEQQPIVWAIRGGIHATEPVSAEPQIELLRWSARALDDGDVHLVGWNVSSLEGRVSSTVTSFDAASSAVTTSTGRRYVLHGPPGSDPDAEYVWSRWRRINGVETWADVTDRFWTQIQAARSSPD